MKENTKTLPKGPETYEVAYVEQQEQRERKKYSLDIWKEIIDFLPEEFTEEEWIKKLLPILKEYSTGDYEGIVKKKNLGKVWIDLCPTLPREPIRWRVSKRKIFATVSFISA